MNEQEWRQYYTQMVLRGGIRSEKQIELVSNCGGKKMLKKPDPKGTPLKPLPDIDVEETQDEAFGRIKGEIEEEASRESLEKKADQILAELRRR